MEEGNPLAALATTGSVGSRFVTQSEIDSAKERREADWKAAYARLGQEPPPRPTEDPEYDGRSLYERLQSQKTAKQEEWEEKTKLSNQFRALEEDEIHFLDSILDEKITKENKRKREENEELKNFREAVSQRTSQQAAPAAPPSSTPKATTSKVALAPNPAKNQPKKNQKSLLKGAIVRKPSAPKSGSAVSQPAASASTTTSTISSKSIPPSAVVSSPQTSATDTPASLAAKDSPDSEGKLLQPSQFDVPGESTDNSQSSKRQRV